jgi:hypothetical protein
VAGEREAFGGHAFISYVREDSRQVDELQRRLEQADVRVWRDTADLWPGEDWRVQIRRAITDDALAFIVCFSRASLGRGKSFQNEELTLAIEQMRLRQPDDPWLIPVRFDDCGIPDRDIGGGRTLDSIQHADLFGDRAEDGTARLVAVVLRILGGRPGAGAAEGDRQTDESGKVKDDKVKDELSAEAITLNFDEAGDPAADGILPILDDYARELSQGRLEGYEFSPRQLSVMNHPNHDLLVVAFREHGYRGVQREVREMDDWYLRGTIMLLNLMFIGQKQTSYAWSSLYWFNRAVRHRQVTFMRQALPEDLRGSYGADFSSGPLSGIRDDIVRFYGRALIKIDLWNADDDRDYISCLFPRDGHAGSWFSEHPQTLRPEKYFPSHYDPREYHDYLMPQMMLRHIAHGERLISDFTNYYICAA